MKKIASWVSLTLFAFVLGTFKTHAVPLAKDHVVIEVVTKYTKTDEALTSAKNILLAKKFIATNGIQEKSFTATRTTGSKADYFVADVTASEVDGKIKITVSFVKIGTGFLNLKKVAEEVKKELAQ